AECNWGAAAVDLGESAEAVAHFRIAKQIAREHGFEDVIRLAIRGLSVALMNLGRFKQAEKSFRECLEFETQCGNLLDAAVALHDIGVVQLHQRRFALARRSLRKACRLARKA